MQQYRLPVLRGRSAQSGARYETRVHRTRGTRGVRSSETGPAFIVRIKPRSRARATEGRGAGTEEPVRGGGYAKRQRNICLTNKLHTEAGTVKSSCIKYIYRRIKRPGSSEFIARP